MQNLNGMNGMSGNFPGGSQGGGLPSGSQGGLPGGTGGIGNVAGNGGAAPGGGRLKTFSCPNIFQFPVLTGALGDPATLADPTLADETQLADPVQPAEPSADDFFDQMYNEMFGNPDDDLVQMESADSPSAPADPPAAADDAAAPADNPAPDDSLDDPPEETPEEVQADEPAEEGSGGGGFFSGFPSFSFPSFFRTFSSRQSRSMYSDRQSRQLFSPCTDRITLPCIVEDFIGAGMGDIPSCIPVHCGSSLCQAGVTSCKLETSVTPFHIGVHFGDGKANKGSPEDNIGACLRYKQLPCS